MKKFISLSLVFVILFSGMQSTSTAATQEAVSFNPSNYSTLESPSSIEDGQLRLVSDGKGYIDAKYDVSLKPSTDYVIRWYVEENTNDDGHFVAVRASGFMEGSDIKFPKNQTGSFEASFTTLSTIRNPYIWSFAQDKYETGTQHIKASFTLYEVVAEQPVPETVAETTTEAIQETAPETTTEAPTEAAPETTTEAPTEAAPETTAEPTAETATEAVAEPTAEVMTEPATEAMTETTTQPAPTYQVMPFNPANYHSVEAPANLNGGQLNLISDGGNYVDAKYNVDLKPATEYLVVFDITKNTYNSGYLAAIRANGLIEGKDVKFPEETLGEFRTLVKTLDTITVPYLWSFAYDPQGGNPEVVVATFDIYEAAQFENPMTADLGERGVVEVTTEVATQAPTTQAPTETTTQAQTTAPTTEAVTEDTVTEAVVSAKMDATAFVTLDSPASIEDDQLRLVSQGKNYIDARQSVALKPGTQYLIVFDISKNTYTDGAFVAVRAKDFIEGKDIKFPKGETGSYRATFTTLKDIKNPYIWSFAYNNTGAGDMVVQSGYKIYEAAQFTDPMTDIIVDKVVATAKPVEATVTMDKAPEVKQEPTENERKAYNVISWQLPHGGWGKNNSDLYTKAWDGTGNQGAYMINGKPYGTIDNWATVPEIEFLMKVYKETGNVDMKNAALKGIDFLLAMQYDTGALPQVYPRANEAKYPYIDHGTYNDDATMMVLSFYKDILEDPTLYSQDLIDSHYRHKIQDAFDRGIDFILKSQIEVDGELTAWGQQHHPYTYAPTKGRSYELVGISGFESANIVKFLISLNSTDPEVVRAINGAVTWFGKVGMDDRKYDRYADSGTYFKAAPGRTMWHRFYEIGTNKGFFCDRDGVKVYDITEIGTERRHGYMWAGQWAEGFVTQTTYASAR